MCPWWHLRSLPNLTSRQAAANSGNVVDEIDTETCHTPSIDLVIGDTSQKELQSFSIHTWSLYDFLVGGWTTHLENISQIGSFPHRGMNTRKEMKPPPSFNIFRRYFGCEAWCQSFGNRGSCALSDDNESGFLEPIGSYWIHMSHVWYTGSRGKRI